MMSNKVLIDKKYSWFKLKYFNNYIFVKTNSFNLAIFKNFFEKEKDIKIKNLKKFVKSLDFYFGIIIENEKNIFCAVDHVRSQPIFFNKNGFVSNSVDLLKKKNGINKSSILEFKMLGYVTNGKTLIKNVYQIESGNIIYFKKKNNKKTEINYYKYLPLYSNDCAIEEFDKILNKVFLKIIKRSNNKTIIVFLSGGLDSRLVLSKLVELNYKKIIAVSYGLKNNHESKKAKEVCDNLNVVWKFYKHDESKIKDLYNSKERINYSKYSSNLSSTPSYLEFEALSKMNQENFLKDKIIINGQTGDFISGSHLTKFINYSKKIKKKNFYKYILKKHYSLWLNLVNKKNREFAKNRINNSIKNNNLTTENKIMANYEYWEWKERQSKLVINGNKAYDFFNTEWEMPLWDIEIVNFFKKMNLNQKKNQNFYLNYLRVKNFKKVFNKLRSKPEIWVGKYKIIKFFGFCLNFLPFNNIKENFYKKMFYYGIDKNQYSMIGEKKYFRNYKNLRNVSSLFSDDYLKQNNLIKKKFKN